MIQTFTVCLNELDKDQSETLLPYTNAKERDNFITELFSNFFRRYKHLDEDPCLDRIIEDLYELKETHNVLINNK